LLVLIGDLKSCGNCKDVAKRSHTDTPRDSKPPVPIQPVKPLKKEKVSSIEEPPKETDVKESDQLISLVGKSVAVPKPAVRKGSQGTFYSGFLK
jgi:hypothetical protein